MVGHGLVKKYFPERLKSWRAQAARHHDDMLWYIIFLRITPFLPNWFINLASPIIGVRLMPFFWGTFLGKLYYTCIVCIRVNINFWYQFVISGEVDINNYYVITLLLTLSLSLSSSPSPSLSLSFSLSPSPTLQVWLLPLFSSSEQGRPFTNWLPPQVTYQSSPFSFLLPWPFYHWLLFYLRELLGENWNNFTSWSSVISVTLINYLLKLIMCWVN